MSDVVVHRNSAKPAQLNALAYAQGNEIHLGSGQEKHLPHEAWHVVQQKQGRVKPTLQMKGGVSINADAGLEKEADAMAAKALAVEVTQFKYGNRLDATSPSSQSNLVKSGGPIQRIIELEYDDVTGEELESNLGFDADKMYLRLKNHCRILKPEDLREELTRLDELNAIFGDTAELIDILMSDGFVAKRPADDFMKSAKVGLELTFNSEKSAEFIKNDGFPEGKKNEAKSWWRSELSAWTSGLEHEDYVATYELEIDIDKSHRQKDFGGDTKDMENWRVVYKYADGSVAWWWQLSMDPGVVEIQTAPTSGGSLSSGFISEIVDTIYKRAAARQFSPGGGGGHVNVDFKTGFNKDPSLIPRILVATEIIVGNLQRSRNDLYASLIDFENELEDPFIGTKRVKMNTKKDGSWDASHLPDSRDERSYYAEWHRDVMEKTGERVKNMKNLQHFREAHAQWLHLHPSLSQQKGATERTGKLTEKRDDEGLRAALHYQAVNIDHLFEEVIEDEEVGVIEDPRRLEFRFFKGQEDIGDIIDCIELIGLIVKKASSL